MDLYHTSKFLESNTFVFNDESSIEKFENKFLMLDIETGKFFEINKTAKEIIDQIINKKSYFDMMKYFQNKYHNFNKDDLNSFLSKLLSMKIIKLDD